MSDSTGMDEVAAHGSRGDRNDMFAPFGQLLTVNKLRICGAVLSNIDVQCHCLLYKPGKEHAGVTGHADDAVVVRKTLSSG